MSSEDTRLLVGVGVGPGDPELVTLRAVRRLREAPVVFVPVSRTGERGRAQSVVEHHVPASKLRKVPFVLGGSGDRDSVVEEAARTVLGVLAEAGWGCFATLGDPSLYSTFYRLVDAMRRLGYRGRVEVEPGITAFQALAAHAEMALAWDTESVSLIAGPEAVAVVGKLDQAPLGDTVVVYKGGSRISDIYRALRKSGGQGRAVYGIGLGTPDQAIYEDDEILGAPDSYLGTLVWRRSERGSRGGDA